MAGPSRPAEWLAGEIREHGGELNAKSIIRRKRDGAKLDEAEIRFLVQGAVSGAVSEYQLTAWMMAVFFRGMDPEETAALTVAMLESGDRLDFGAGGTPPADKHSTGGVGDKISFLVAPLVAAVGVPVPMVSGRSLGHTGGTLDKLESIPGLRTGFEPEEIRALVERIGLCFAGTEQAHRSGRCHPLCAARRRFHRGVDSADHGQHPQQEGRRRGAEPGPRREGGRGRFHVGAGAGAGPGPVAHRHRRSSSESAPAPT